MPPEVIFRTSRYIPFRVVPTSLAGSTTPSTIFTRSLARRRVTRFLSRARRGHGSRERGRVLVRGPAGGRGAGTCPGTRAGAGVGAGTPTSTSTFTTTAGPRDHHALRPARHQLLLQHRSRAEPRRAAV